MAHQFSIRDRRTQKRFFIDNAIIRGYGWIIKAQGIAIYNALCLHADIDNQNCWPSHKTIADEIGMGVTAVKNYLYLMRQLCLIDWQEQVLDGKGQTSNMYYLLDPPDPPVLSTFKYPPYMHLNPAQNPHMGKETPSHDMATPQPCSGYPPSHDMATNNPHMNNPHGTRVPIGTGAGAPAADAAHSFLPGTEFYQKKIPIVEHYPEDTTFECPVCSEQVSWPTRKTGFICSACGSPLAGFELGNPHDRTPDWKPPRQAAQKRDARTLGALFPDCPPSLRAVRYMARDREALQAAHTAHAELLWGEIHYQAVQNMENKCPAHMIASNGLTSAQRKLPIALQPKEEYETQAERDARTPAKVASELDNVW